MKIKSQFLISVLLNLALIGFTGYMLARRPAQREVQATPPVSQPPIMAPVVADMETEHPTTSKPFHWSQLESTDYPTYIANLRAIGCPEETIRDIITADVASLYERKQQEALTQQGAMGNTAAGQGQSRQPLRREETSVIMSLLGTQTQANTVGIISGARNNELQTADSSLNGSNSEENMPGHTFIPARDNRISMPLALVDPGPDMKLNDRQQAMLGTLRQDFVNAVGGPNQDPSSPDYRSRWLTAQSESDQRFKAMFGWQAFIQQQIRANQRPAISPQR